MNYSKGLRNVKQNKAFKNKWKTTLPQASNKNLRGTRYSTTVPNVKITHIKYEQNGTVQLNVLQEEKKSLVFVRTPVYREYQPLIYNTAQMTFEGIVRFCLSSSDVLFILKDIEHCFLILLFFRYFTETLYHIYIGLTFSPFRPWRPPYQERFAQSDRWMLALLSSL